MTHLSEQELLRRSNLEKIKELGVEPYPAEAFEVNAFSQQIVAEFKDGEDNFPQARLAGRMMSVRLMGKAAFAELQDSTGRIQLYISRDDISNGEDKRLYDDLFKRYLDLGDYIGVTGFAFRTKMGEITIHVKSLTLLAKSLRPLPVVKRDEEGNIYDGFTDPELRYRQRYVDLTVNPDYRRIFITRSRLISAMRRFFDEQGLLEVETPILQSIHGGALARPFKTHHNALDMPLFMRIANELYLKRLIVAGFDGVYEFGKMFRNEGMDRTHNPEFTMVELYVAYKDYYWMMEFVETLFEQIAKTVFSTTAIPFGEKVLEFAGPYKRMTMYESIQTYTGIDVSEMDEAALRQCCADLGIHADPKLGRGKLIDEIFSEKVEEHLIQPTFITEHPMDMSPLAKKHRSKDGVVERFELFINGKEVANAYSELNDPIDQRARFEEQLELGRRGDDEAMVLDEDYLRAMEYGMPPTSGLGIGIDRITMMMTGQKSIQEVLLFPQMRPETHP